MKDYSEYVAESLNAPANEAYTVTPNDGANLGGEHAAVPRALYVGSAGDVAVDMHKGGTNVLFAGIPAGTILPIRVTKVYLTGTTAGDLVAIY